jgi:hypothetical protein
MLAYAVRMLTYADACSGSALRERRVEGRAMTYADVCYAVRMLTYADVCSGSARRERRVEGRAMTYADVCCTYAAVAHVC